MFYTPSEIGAGNSTLGSRISPCCPLMGLGKHRGMNVDAKKLRCREIRELLLNRPRFPHQETSGMFCIPGQCLISNTRV